MSGIPHTLAGLFGLAVMPQLCVYLQVKLICMSIYSVNEFALKQVQIQPFGSLVLSASTYIHGHLLCEWTYFSLLTRWTPLWLWIVMKVVWTDIIIVFDVDFNRAMDTSLHKWTCNYMYECTCILLLCWWFSANVSQSFNNGRSKVPGEEVLDYRRGVPVEEEWVSCCMRGVRPWSGGLMGISNREVAFCIIASNHPHVSAYKPWQVRQDNCV